MRVIDSATDLFYHIKLNLILQQLITTLQVSVSVVC